MASQLRQIYIIDEKTMSVLQEMSVAYHEQ